ncbi:MAG: hypothetical protein PHH85_01670 [Candidatus Methanoperedens sp.]|nr:hypothetical protein [Candidatus Methanoperedens sp.]
MVRLKKASDGSYSVTVRKALVESRGWNKGDEMTLFTVGGDIMAYPGDLVLRRTGYSKEKPGKN